ncbi:gluconate 2-dehydrogenase subunit 3 family protein [Burkholderia pseudomallei]
MGYVTEEIGSFRRLTNSSTGIGPGATSQGYGGDPNMVTPAAPWKSALTALELDTIISLSDVILPGTRHELAPSRVNIGAFFDEWLSAPYPTQSSDRKVILDGVKLLEAESQQRFGAAFSNLSSARHVELVAWLANSQGTTREFFVRFRYLLLGGYFTSDHGMQAIGYRGNVPLNTFPPVTAEALQIIREELSKLALL